MVPTARVLGKYVREEGILSLEEAIRKMTSLPAQKFGLHDRGLIKEGMAADLVIFNPEIIGDQATFERPHAYAKGISYLFVNGALTIKDEKQTLMRAGRILRLK